LSKDIIEGEKDKIKGKLRETEGRITGSPTDVVEGELEQDKGDVKKKIGKLKYDL